MELIVHILGAIAAVVLLAAAATLLLARWIAAGESDTNGDPERDARS